jgi:hypothetical protein
MFRVLCCVDTRVYAHRRVYEWHPYTNGIVGQWHTTRVYEWHPYTNGIVGQWGKIF